MSATPCTGFKGAGGRAGERNAGMRRGGETGVGGGSAHGSHHHNPSGDSSGGGDGVREGERSSLGPGQDTVAQALNFQSVNS